MRKVIVQDALVGVARKKREGGAYGLALLIGEDVVKQVVGGRKASCHGKRRLVTAAPAVGEAVIVMIPRCDLQKDLFAKRGGRLVTKQLPAEAERDQVAVNVSTDVVGINTRLKMGVSLIAELKGRLVGRVRQPLPKCDADILAEHLKVLGMIRKKVGDILAEEEGTRMHRRIDRIVDLIPRRRDKGHGVFGDLKVHRAALALARKDVPFVAPCGQGGLGADKAAVGGKLVGRAVLVAQGNGVDLLGIRLILQPDQAGGAFKDKLSLVGEGENIARCGADLLKPFHFRAPFSLFSSTRYIRPCRG